MSMKKVR
jgi:hypothetical protein